MSFDLINFAMLTGLAGLSLPILAHLLSKKKYDIVHWGAMQFLELGRNARRRIRLEELLLLLLRMALIALIVFALSRPWVSGGVFSKLVSGQSRDVVFVIDGSYSMGWEGRARTPHADAIQFVHEFLESLRPGDSVALLDARSDVRPVIESPTRDFGFVREQLDTLPEPSGTSDLAAACVRAVQILSRTSNLAREVIVLSDGQSLPWSASDGPLWAGFDELLNQPSARPNVWFVDVAGGENPEKRSNFSVDRIDLSRELTVQQFPIRITTKVRYSGGDAPATRRVYLEVDGQRLADQTISLNLQPDGESTVEFDHRFQSTGSHLVSVVLDDDNLPGDDRADAAVSISDALPVLLVDGDWNLDVTRRETFFAMAALSAAANETPWIKATTRSADELASDDLSEPVVVVLANVARLTEAQTGAVKDHVLRGGGLVVALGDQVDADYYNEHLFEGGAGLLPASLTAIEENEDDRNNGRQVANGSLQVPWIERFRTENDGGFTDARFDHWWHVTPAAARDEAAGDGQADMQAPAIVSARLDNGRPVIVTRRFGRGHVLLMAVPIDADWSTLPAKQDYVSLMHETIFFVASGKTIRNVDSGAPIVFPVSRTTEIDQLAFFGPADSVFDAEQAGNELQPVVRLSDTRLPGVYELRNRDDAGAVEPERFVVNFDRRESDLTALSEDEVTALAVNDRMTIVSDISDLREKMFSGESHTEFWYVLLLIFLGLLIFEVVMTRRLVRGGHAVVDPADVAIDGETMDPEVVDDSDSHQRRERTPATTGP